MLIWDVGVGEGEGRGVRNNEDVTAMKTEWFAIIAQNSCDAFPTDSSWYFIFYHLVQLHLPSAAHLRTWLLASTSMDLLSTTLTLP